MWLGEALWGGCAVAGLAVVPRTLGVVFVVIKLIGVAYLLYLAWKMWFAPTQVSKGEMPSASSPWRMFGTGLTITLRSEDHTPQLHSPHHLVSRLLLEKKNQHTT